MALALRYSANGVFAALFAPECVACTDLLDEPLSGCVCARCRDAIGSSVPQQFGREDGSAIDSGCAAGEYEGPLRAVVHALKYDGRRSLAPLLAAVMRSRGAPVLAGADLAVPVPLHWRRQMRRGFNQSADLAAGTGLPVASILTRIRHTRPQVELEADVRRTNVQHAFALSRRARRTPAVDSRTIVLVDDVWTTGATLEACARLLKRAGAADVRVLTAARVSQAPAQEPRSARPIPTAARGRRTHASRD